MIIQPYAGGGAAGKLKVYGTASEALFSDTVTSTGQSQFSLGGFGTMPKIDSAGALYMVVKDSGDKEIYSAGFVTSALVSTAHELRCIGKDTSGRPVLCEIVYAVVNWDLRFYYLNSGVLNSYTVPSGYKVSLALYPLYAGKA